MQQSIAGGQENADLLALEQPLDAVDNALEHRLGVRHRAADDAQHLRRCGLMLQRFLRLVEQPHVLDRNHGLIGEGQQQVDIAPGKRSRFLARDTDSADRACGAPKRHHDPAAEASCPGNVSGHQVTVSIGLRIRDFDDFPAIHLFKYQPPGNRHRERCPQHCIRFGTDRRECCQLDRIAHNAKNGACVAVDQAVSAIGYGLKHRLHFGWRTGDHLENVGRRGLPFQRFLCLVEQPHILDRDHRLVGKGAQQGQFLFAEHRVRRPRDRDHADALALPNHRGHHQRVVAHRLRHPARER